MPSASRVQSCTHTYTYTHISSHSIALPTCVLRRRSQRLRQGGRGRTKAGTDDDGHRHSALAQLPGYPSTNPPVYPTVARRQPWVLNVILHFVTSWLIWLESYLFLLCWRQRNFLALYQRSLLLYPSRGWRVEREGGKQDISNTIKNKYLFFISVIRSNSFGVTWPMFFHCYTQWHSFLTFVWKVSNSKGYLTVC